MLLTEISHLSQTHSFDDGPKKSQEMFFRGNYCFRYSPKMSTQISVGWQGCIQPFPTLTRKGLIKDWCWYRVFLLLLCVLSEELLPGMHPFSPVLDPCQGEGGRKGGIFIFCWTSWLNLVPVQH